MRLAQEFRAYHEALLRLIFPSICGLCQTTLHLYESELCSGCKQRVQELALPVEKRLIDQDFKAIHQAWTLFPYTDSVKETLHKVKFERKRGLLKVFQSSFAEWGESLKSEFHYDFIIPMPVDREKLMRREFNQSAVLSRFISQKTGLPVKDALRKRFATPSQSRLSRRERLLNLMGTFRVSNKQNLKDASVLLVDDVLTTGATAEEAGRALKHYGAKKIDVLVLAHTDKKGILNEGS